MSWPALPFDVWRATCDTLHAHTQVLGKLAVALAPPEPQLQHAALRLSARGWETLPLPAPEGSGALVVALDLRTHEAANTTPQETPWTTPLDEDTEHATYNPVHVAAYHAAATQAALVLAALRAPYRGRSTPVNAWWGSFDLAVSLFSGEPANPQSQDFIARNSGDAQQIEVGWWPGDHRYPRAAFYAYAYPSQERFAEGTLSPPSARWDETLGEYVLDWDDVRAGADPYEAALSFARSAVEHGCRVCDWNPRLAASMEGDPPPIV
jgi:hypothetical protein